MWRSLGKAAATESGTRRMEEKQTLYVFVQDEAGGAEKARSPVMHEAVWSRLPEDVLVQVLMRVPVLSHMRFRCVCRKWQAMLSDPSFVALCPPPQGMCSLGQKPGLGAGLNSFELPDSVLRVRTLSLSFLPLSSWILLASDKGLLLLGMEKGLLLQPLWQDVDDICLCVCNPVSKSWIQLPPLRTDMADEVLGTFLDVDAAAEAYRVVVVASNEQRQLIFVYRPGACVWDRMDWLNPLPGQHELVLCHGVIHGFWSDSRYASPRMKLLSFSLELGRPLGDTELARPDGAHLADTKLAVHEGCLLLVGSRTTTCQGFGIWKLDPIRMQWELVSTAPDELFLKGRKQCAKLVIKVGTVGEFISIEYDVARDHRTEKWVEELLAFHTGLKTWHAWHLPGLANPRRGLLDRKLVSFDPDWTRHCDPVKL